jgi:MFS family permease
MLICNVFCFAIGCLIYVQNFPTLIICRFCQGLGTGFFTAVAPLMVRELSPNEIAGALGSYTELNICLGVLIGCIAPYSMVKITGDETAKAYWYLIFGIPQIVIVIQLVSLFIFPYETPKYLLAIGK